MNIHKKKARNALSARAVSTDENVKSMKLSNISKRSQTADCCSITYNPFQKVKSELSLKSETLIHRNNHKRITPTTRYNVLNKYASLHSLTNIQTIDNNNKENIQYLPTIVPKINLNQCKSSYIKINNDCNLSTFQNML